MSQGLISERELTAKQRFDFEFDRAFRTAIQDTDFLMRPNWIKVSHFPPVSLEMDPNRWFHYSQDEILALRTAWMVIVYHRFEMLFQPPLTATARVRPMYRWIQRELGDFVQPR